MGLLPQLEEQRYLGPCPAWALSSSSESRVGSGTHRGLPLHRALFQVTCAWAEAEHGMEAISLLREDLEQEP